MKFFKFLFAEDGDKTAIPDVTQPSGQVSYEEGYGPEYELPQADPDKRNIERRQHNQLLHDLTLNSKQYHTNGFPEFITAAENDGVAYEYDYAACVRYDGHSGPGIYFSLVDANDTDPSDATKWVLFSPNSMWRTGDIKETDRTDLESGWVWRNGQTIGNPDSGATGRANADTYNLFVLYWTTRPNSVCPIQNSDGSAGIRGASALADWNANKRLPVSDLRGRTSAGHDAMGGAPAANRMTAAVTGVPNGGQIGAFGGSQTIELDGSQNGTHTHPVPSFLVSQATLMTDFTGGAYAYGADGGQSYFVPDSPPKITTQDSGQGLAHGNVQPTLISNFMVKL